MNAVLAIGRILFAFIFVSSGVMGHLMKLDAMTAYAKYKKLPAAKLSVIVSGLMITVGGIFVALGIYADLGALLLVIFLIPTAFIMHNFWAETDPTAKQSEMSAFLKDIALAGAALIIFVLVGRHTPFGWHITAPLFNFK
jgi:putative oxidoreductase